MGNTGSFFQVHLGYCKSRATYTSHYCTYLDRDGQCPGSRTQPIKPIADEEETTEFQRVLAGVCIRLYSSKLHHATSSYTSTAGVLQIFSAIYKPDAPRQKLTVLRPPCMVINVSQAFQEPQKTLTFSTQLTCAVSSVIPNNKMTLISNT